MSKSMSERICDAAAARERFKYRNKMDRAFCTIDGLADQYPLAVPKDKVIGKDWAVYIFQLDGTTSPVWVLSIDLPLNWEKIDMPMQTINEVVRQHDHCIIFTLSGSHCTESVWLDCMTMILSSVQTSKRQG